MLAAVGTTEISPGGEEPNVTAYRAAFFAAALFALKVPDEVAAARMRRRRA